MVDLIESIMQEVCKYCILYDGNAPCKEPREDCKCNWDMTTDGIKTWLSSFDTDSATKCFEAVNLLKERVEKNE